MILFIPTAPKNDIWDTDVQSRSHTVIIQRPFFPKQSPVRWHGSRALVVVSSLFLAGMRTEGMTALFPSTTTYSSPAAAGPAEREQDYEPYYGKLLTSEY